MRFSLPMKSAGDHVRLDSDDGPFAVSGVQEAT